MPKAEIKALLLGGTLPCPSPHPEFLSKAALSPSPSSNARTPTLPSLALAVAAFKESTAKVREAQGRHRVLARQLEKQKSTTLNAQRHCEHSEYVRQSAQLDRCVLQWNEANRQRRINEQSLANRQSRERIRRNIDHSRSFFQAANAQRKHSLKQQSKLNDHLLRSIEQDTTNTLVKRREDKRKEEQLRQQYVAAFHTRKQQAVRKEKNREIQQLFSQSVDNHAAVNQIVDRNRSLKQRRYQQEETAARLPFDGPPNLASTIKNPEVYL